jgi:hypothetical protein
MLLKMADAALRNYYRHPDAAKSTGTVMIAMNIDTCARDLYSRPAKKHVVIDIYGNENKFKSRMDIGLCQSGWDVGMGKPVNLLKRLDTLNQLFC